VTADPLDGVRNVVGVTEKSTVTPGVALPNSSLTVAVTQCS
jgi:hypothetical protein